MKNHLKHTWFRKIIQLYLKQKEKEHDQDFYITFLKIEGKTWDQHMADICNKDKEREVDI